VGEKQFLEVAKAERRGVNLPAPSFRGFSINGALN